jgi:hypothetical protein
MWPHGINFGFVFSPLVWWRRTTRLAGGWWRVLIYSKSDLFWEKSTAGWWLISQANKLTVRDRCKLLRGRPRILSVLQFGRWSWPHDVLRWSMSFYVWKSFGFFFLILLCLPDEFWRTVCRWCYVWLANVIFGHSLLCCPLTLGKWNVHLPCGSW